MVANVPAIVSRIVRPEAADMPAVMAEKVLTWQFTDADRNRVAELLEKNSAGNLSRDEMRELDTYTVLGDLLNILHAQADLSLKQSGSSRTT
jgi:hypothetical protein